MHGSNNNLHGEHQIEITKKQQSEHVDILKMHSNSAMKDTVDQGALSLLGKGGLVELKSSGSKLKPQRMIR